MCKEYILVDLGYEGVPTQTCTRPGFDCLAKLMYLVYANLRYEGHARFIKGYFKDIQRGFEGASTEHTVAEMIRKSERIMNQANVILRRCQAFISLLEASLPALV